MKFNAYLYIYIGGYQGYHRVIRGLSFIRMYINIHERERCQLHSPEGLLKVTTNNTKVIRVIKVLIGGSGRDRIWKSSNKS